MWFRSQIIVFSVLSFNYAKALPLNIQAQQTNSPKNTAIDTVDYTKVKASSFAAVRSSSPAEKEPCDDPSGIYSPERQVADRNALKPFNFVAEQSDNRRVDATQSYGLETTRKPLSLMRNRVKETTRTPINEPYNSDQEQNVQSFSQRRPAQSAISYNYEASRKSVQIVQTNPSNSGRPGGSYTDYSERPSQGAANDYVAVNRPSYNSEKRRPTQIINYPPPSNQESGNYNQNANTQNSELSRFPPSNIDNNRGPPNYSQSQVSQYPGKYPESFQNDKVELSHIRDERPLLTPNQKIQIVIDYPTANYNNSDGNADFTTRAPLRRPEQNRNRKRNQGSS